MSIQNIIGNVIYSEYFLKENFVTFWMCGRLYT